MTMKMTERDKKLLIFLITTLILFLFGWVLIRPIMKKGMEIKEDTARQEQLRDENELKMMQMAVLLNKVPENEEKLESLKEVFYPLMTEQEIDRIFTGAALTHGVEVSKLYISIVEETQQVLPYVLRPAESEEGTQTADTQEAALLHLERADVDFVLTGTQAKLQALLDTIANDYDAVLIDSVTWKRTPNRAKRETTEATKGNQDSEPATLTLSMDLYMYQE